jgi:hypothetical protein
MNPISTFRIDGGSLALKFVNALEKSYSPERFDQMLFTRLSIQRTSITLANDMPTRFYDVLIDANHRGWTAKYVTAALEANPGSAPLRAFAVELGLNPIAANDATNLQKVVADESVFHDAEPFLAALGSRISWVCQVVVPGGGGTGVLIAPNLVLTNHHVVASVLEKKIAPGKVACIFDFKQLKGGQQLSPGRQVQLDPDWIVAWRPHSPEDTVRDGGRPAPEQLDYAILRLAVKVGEEPVGETGASDIAAAPRGWLRLPSDDRPLEKNNPLFVLQHPLLPGRLTQEPVQLSLGVVLESPFSALRLRHNARTMGGSSGSPCFNANLEFVALHHAGDPVVPWERAVWNQAIPVQNIVADLIAQGIDPKLWEL